MRYNESGHATNTAAFNQLCVYLSEIGERYNPSNVLIQLVALYKVNQLIKEAMKVLKEKENAFSKLIKVKQEEIEPLNKLVTRILGEIDSTNISASGKKAIRVLGDKLKGSNGSKKSSPSKTEDGKEGSGHSRSQLSFVMRVDNFEKLVVMLESTPEYSPVEDDLKVTSLRELITKLLEHKDSITKLEKGVKDARTVRDTLLYSEETGAATLLKKVKAHVKSWKEGTDGADYKRINSISMKKYK